MRCSFKTSDTDNTQGAGLLYRALHALMELVRRQKVHKLGKHRLSYVHRPSPSGLIQKYALIASRKFQIQIKKHIESRTLVIAHFALCPESNVGTAVRAFHNWFPICQRPVVLNAARLCESLAIPVVLEHKEIVFFLFFCQKRKDF